MFLEITVGVVIEGGSLPCLNTHQTNLVIQNRFIIPMLLWLCAL